MFDNIESFRMARAMANNASERQQIVARNVANADTPGYLASDMESFADSYRATTAYSEMRATHPRHLTDPGWVVSGARVTTAESGASPNGNSVSIEDEMVKMTAAKRQQDIALGVYRSGIDILRTSLGRQA